MKHDIHLTWLATDLAGAAVRAPSLSTQTQFRVALDPAQRGFTAVPPTGAFWIIPVSFGNHLYAGLADGTTGLQIVRSADGSEWEKIPQPSPYDPRYNNVWNVFVYRGCMYLSLIEDRCADPANQTPGLIVRTANGKDWETVFQTAEVDGLVNQTGHLGAYDGMLYAATMPGFGQTGNAQLWRSRSGDPGAWELATPCLGQNTDFTSSLTTFRGCAYLSTHDRAGMHVWRSDDGTQWTAVGDKVWGDPQLTNWWGSNLVVFDDCLYIGTHPWFFWLFRDIAGTYQGGGLYRSRDGVEWELVVEQGFERLHRNQHPTGIDSLIVFRDQLVAFCNDLAPDWSSSAVNVWCSPTGNPGDWACASEVGLGANTLVTKGDVAAFKDRLYIGNQATFFNAAPNLIEMID